MPAPLIPEAESLDISLRGSFNPAILHPQWFLRQKLVGEEEASSAAIKWVSPEITDVAFAGINLVCLPQSLTVRTANVAYVPRVFDLVDGILKLLPYTPIRACGINAHVHCRVRTVEYWHQIGHALAPKELIWDDLFEQPGLQNLTIKAKRGGKFPGEINVAVEPSLLVNPGVYIQTNTHFSVASKPEEGGGADVVRAFLTAEGESATQQARVVAGKIFDKIQPDE